MRNWCSLHRASETVQVRSEQQPRAEEERQCSKDGQCEDERDNLWRRLLIRTENVMNLWLSSITLWRSICWQLALLILLHVEREDFGKKRLGLSEGSDDDAGFERLCQQSDWELGGREVEDGAAGVFDCQGVCSLETGGGGEEEVNLVWAGCGGAGLCCEEELQGVCCGERDLFGKWFRCGEPVHTVISSVYRE